MKCFQVLPNGEIDSFLLTKVVLPKRVPPLIRVFVTDLMGEEILIGPTLALDRHDKWSYNGAWKVTLKECHAVPLALCLFIHQPPYGKAEPTPILGMEDSQLIDSCRSAYNGWVLGELFTFSKSTTLKQGGFLWTISPDQELVRTCL